MTKRVALDRDATPPDPEVWEFPIRLGRDDLLVRCVLDGQPIPWSRVQTGARGQHYVSRRFLDWRNALGWVLSNAYNHPGHGVQIGDLGLWVTFYRSSNHRVDIDNLVKGVMDAGNGVVWADDSQIKALLARIHKDRDQPRTEVVVYRLDP